MEQRNTRSLGSLGMTDPHKTLSSYVCELTPGPSLQAERGAQMLAFIPDYLVVFEYAASDIPPLCFQRGGQGVSKI